jgi:hypothetical protein
VRGRERRAAATQPREGPHQGAWVGGGCEGEREKSQLLPSHVKGRIKVRGWVVAVRGREREPWLHRQQRKRKSYAWLPRSRRGSLSWRERSRVPPATRGSSTYLSSRGGVWQAGGWLDISLKAVATDLKVRALFRVADEHPSGTPIAF